jgi:hypothetical protein
MLLTPLLCQKPGSSLFVFVPAFFSLFQVRVSQGAQHAADPHSLGRSRAEEGAAEGLKHGCLQVSHCHGGWRPSSGSGFRCKHYPITLHTHGVLKSILVCLQLSEQGQQMSNRYSAFQDAYALTSIITMVVVVRGGGGGAQRMGAISCSTCKGRCVAVLGSDAVASKEGVCRP